MRGQSYLISEPIILQSPQMSLMMLLSLQTRAVAKLYPTYPTTVMHALVLPHSSTGSSRSTLPS